MELAWEVRRVTWAHGCGPQAPGGAWPCGRTRGADCPSRYAPVPAHLEAERVHGGLWLLRPKTAGSHRSPGLPADLVYSAKAWYLQPFVLECWRQVYMATARANGGEPNAGSHLPPRFHQSGAASHSRGSSCRPPR